MSPSPVENWPRMDQIVLMSEAWMFPAPTAPEAHPVLILMKVLPQIDDERVGAKADGAAVSPAMQAIEALVADIAAIGIPVLITGETGTGKDVTALAIHRQSPRRQAPFVKVRCSSLQAEDLAQVLADWEASISSGLRSTIFLDEIAELSLDCQARILELFSRLDAGPERHQSGAGILCSSCRNLREAMEAGTLRRDLYYRLKGVCVRLPPLRERKEDILPLAGFFLNRYSEIYSRPRPQLGAAMARRLCEYRWPGNIRELENAMKRMAALGSWAVVEADLEMQPSEHASPVADRPEFSLKEAARAASRRAERELILKVLSRTRWNRKQAAEQLQISYKALLYKLKQIGLEEPVS